MRLSLTFFGAILLIALVTSLGALAQRLTLDTTTKVNPRVDIHGCMVVPMRTTMWDLTHGEWGKKGVREFFYKKTPALAEPWRHFDWEGHGPDSGVTILPGERICGFQSEAVTSVLLIPVRPNENEKLRAELAAANQKADETQARLFLVLIALVVMAIIALLIYMLKNKQFTRAQAEADNQRLNVVVASNALEAAAATHGIQIRTLTERHDGVIAELSAAITQMKAAHATEVAAVHSLYNPCDGPPVVERGLLPLSSTELEAAVMKAAYTDYVGTSTLLPKFERAIATQSLERIGPLVFGRLNGRGYVRNGDGKRVPKIFRNEPVYKTEVRFPNGDERVVYSHQQCGNPIYRGEWSEGNELVFTPAPIAAEVLSAPPAPAPAETVQEFNFPQLGARVKVFGSVFVEEGGSEGKFGILTLQKQPAEVHALENKPA